MRGASGYPWIAGLLCNLPNEQDIKKGIENPLYVPRWKEKEKENICNKKKCIVPMCSCMSNITTTNICTALEVASMLGFTIDDLDNTPSNSDAL